MSRKWISIDFLEAKEKLPTIPCCYVLYFNGAMKYIGSTNNLRNRFSGHSIRYGYWNEIITPWGDFDIPVTITMKYKESRRYGDWLMTEARLIRRLQPQFNSKLKGRKAA